MLNGGVEMVVSEQLSYMLAEIAEQFAKDEPRFPLSGYVLFDNNFVYLTSRSRCVRFPFKYSGERFTTHVINILGGEGVKELYKEREQHHHILKLWPAQFNYLFEGYNSFWDVPTEHLFQVWDDLLLETDGLLSTVKDPTQIFTRFVGSPNGLQVEVVDSKRHKAVWSLSNEPSKTTITVAVPRRKTFQALLTCDPPTVKVALRQNHPRLLLTSESSGVQHVVTGFGDKNATRH